MTEDNPYDKLRNDITKVLILDIDTLKPDSFELAANRTRIDNTMVVVRKFILERLADDVRYKEIMGE